MYEKVGKIGKNRGLGGFLRGKWGFRGFRGGKGEYFEGVTLIGEGFWVKWGYLTGKCGKRGVECLELQRGQVGYYKKEQETRKIICIMGL